MIDGVADLVEDINDIEQSNKIISTLMKWSKDYNLYISTIIHQNKNDNYATGHLGSALIKKSEAVISVEKHSENPKYSKVSCDNIRGAMEFEDFSFYIDDNLMPKIDWDKTEEDNLNKQFDGL